MIPKSFSISTILLTLLMLSALPAEAKMFYYTFEGTYTKASFDFAQGQEGTDIPSELNRIGETAFYTFGIDSSQLGIIGLDSGEIREMENSQYIEYIWGTALSGYNNFIPGIREQVYHPSMDAFSTTSYGNKFRAALHSLDVGAELLLAEHYSNGNSYADSNPGVFNAMITARAQLISVSSTNPYATAATPIPGAVWLLGSGIAGVLGLRRRINR